MDVNYGNFNVLTLFLNDDNVKGVKLTATMETNSNCLISNAFEEKLSLE